MSRDAELIETLEHCISRERGLLAAHGVGSSKPWPLDDIRAAEGRLVDLKFMRDRLRDRVDQRGAA